MTTGRKLTCKCCGKDMGEIRDARLRLGMVVYCATCDAVIERLLNRKEQEAEYGGMPDFMRGLFGRR